MNNLLLVAAGGAMGASARHLVGVFTLRAFGSNFPVGTMVVNIVGCLAMGIIAGLFALKLQAPEPVRLLLTTGFLGGFTTFSAFALDFTVLWDRGEIALAIGYVAVSVLVSLGALAMGLWLVRSLA
jgi:fluoride exporter